MSKKQTRRAAREAFPKAKAPVAPKPSGGRYTSKTARAKAQTRGTRRLKKPSWKRAIIIGVVLAVVYFLVLYVWKMGGGLTVWGALLYSFIGFVIFAPLSYVMDRFTYQRNLRKLKDGGGQTSRSGK
jgi:hypothetical protein